MSEFNTILIVGATSGLGREFARRYHARGKKVIATGRRADRLSELKKELSGIETYEMDVLNIEAFASQAKNLVETHSVDTVMMIAGVMESYFFSQPSVSLATAVNEVTANLSAPVALAHTLCPIFAAKPTTTNLIFTSSGLAYQPAPFYPVYCPTKAAIHSLCVCIRSQLADTKCNIIELNPPYVDTELDSRFRKQVDDMQGGQGGKPKPLGEYMDSAMKGLDERDAEGKPKKEVSLEFSEMGASKWREAYQPWLDMIHVKG